MWPKAAEDLILWQWNSLRRTNLGSVTPAPGKSLTSVLFISFVDSTIFSEYLLCVRLSKVAQAASVNKADTCGCLRELTFKKGGTVLISV